MLILSDFLDTVVADLVNGTNGRTAKLNTVSLLDANDLFYELRNLPEEKVIESAERLNVSVGLVQDAMSILTMELLK